MMFFKKKRKEEPVEEQSAGFEDDFKRAIPEDLRLKLDAPPEQPGAPPEHRPLRTAEEAPEGDERMDLVLSKLDAIEARLKMIERKMKA